jgi:hypothetical protein
MLSHLNKVLALVEVLEAFLEPQPTLAIKNCLTDSNFGTSIIIRNFRFRPKKASLTIKEKNYILKKIKDLMN